MRAHWAPSGAWRMPVGDPYAVSLERQPAPGPFFVVRNVEWDGMRASHQGADLGSGEAGAVVRAAAAGLVVRAADQGEYGGYGTHVVLAHRLPEGVLAYSVYAHLRTGSIRVKAGRFVQAGAPLGRVGMTGRASAPHLHFEIRVGRDPGERWEFADVEDPLAFIEERLPAHRADSAGVAAYLEWGEYAALLPPGSQGDETLTREHWWRMLAVAARGPLLDPASNAAGLRDSLLGNGVLAGPPGDARSATGWAELAHDLNRARRKGLRVGPAPFRRARHETVCGAHFGEAAPSRRTSALSGRAGTPTLTDAVLLLADLAGPVPEPTAPKAPVRAKAPGGAVVLAKGTGRPAVTAGLAGARTPGAKAGPDSLAAGSRARPAADPVRRAGPAKPRSDSLAARARATPAAAPRSAPSRPDTSGRGGRGAASADSAADPRPVPHAPAAPADSSGR
jgi:murein DD-endopeptidase MepM/ murein hydrolase activator NlpD